jgi:hypothetical protein
MKTYYSKSIRISLSIYSIIFFLALFFSSCSENGDKNKSGNESTEQIKSPEKNYEENNLADPSNLQMLDSLALFLNAAYNITPEECKLKFGEPNAIKEDTIRNEHSEELDEYFTINYDTLEIMLYHQVSSDEYFLLSVDLTNDITYGELVVNIGTSKSEILSQFGKPAHEITDEKETTVIYSVNENMNNINFCFAEDILYKIAFIPYFD